MGDANRLEWWKKIDQLVQIFKTFQYNTLSASMLALVKVENRCIIFLHLDCLDGIDR